MQIINLGKYLGKAKDKWENKVKTIRKIIIFNYY
jgi:hypothetical protein